MANYIVLLLLLIVVIYISQSTSNSEGFTATPFNSSKSCNNSDQCYLNSVGSSLSTGTAQRKFNNKGDYLQLHVQGNLPETQATFELTSKDNCDCHCNSLFDCYCKKSPGCPSYKVYLSAIGKSPMYIGDLSKFRNGISYLTVSLSGANASKALKRNFIDIYFENNGHKIQVLKGKFPSRAILCDEEAV